MEGLAKQPKLEVFLTASVLLGLLTVGNAEVCPAIGVENNKALIPDSHMSSSSEFSSSYVASNGRLNSTYSWQPDFYDFSPQLIIDLGSVYNICAVATQGNGGSDGLGNGLQEWTTSYYLRYSSNTTGWTYYKEGNINKLFGGNNDTRTVVKNTLPKTILARFVSFEPYGYKSYVALRVEVYGVHVSDLKHICENETCIYFTDQKNIRALDIEDRTYKTVVPNLVSGAAVDVHVRKNMVFWSDTSRKTISKVNLTSGSVEDIVTGVSASGIAVDWMANVIYWCDPFSETIEVAQLTGKNRKALFNKDISYPRDVVVEPIKGFLFWSDSSKNKIYRSSLAGEDRVGIVTASSSPRGLVIDYDNEVLYWLEWINEYLEGSNYDGSNFKKYIFLGQASFVSPAYITLLGDLFYWTDTEKNSIEQLNRTASPMEALPSFGKVFSNLRGIAAFNLSRQPLGNHACSVSNGNCSHLCLLSTGNGKKCSCPSGMFLREDALTCQNLTDFLIVTEPGNSILKKVWIGGNLSQPLAFNPFHSYNPIGVACDAVNKQVYWTDNYLDEVYVTDFDAKMSKPIVKNIRGISRVAFDSVAKNLYIAEFSSNKIILANIAGNSTRKKTLTNVKSPQSIALDLKLGYMYIASSPSGENHTILKADMNGANIQKLLELNESSPVGLVLDKKQDRLYWAEEKTRMIRYVQLNDVSNIKTLVTLSFPVIHLEMTSILNYLYVVESGSWWYLLGNVYRIDTATGQVTKIVQNLFEPRGICSYSASAPLPPTTGACSTNNGNCGDSICVTKPNGKSCVCPDGQKLVGSSCENFVDHIIVAETLAISKIFSEDSLSKTVLPLSFIDEPNALAYDEEMGFIYWSDDYYDDINRARLDGNFQSQLLRNVKKPDSVALDTVARNMYFVDSASDLVEVATENSNGGFRATLFDKIPTPKSIALDLQNRYMYIAMWSSVNHTIARADLDGQNFKVIATLGNTGPQGLVLDSEAKQLCWVEEKAKTISCLSLSTFMVSKLTDVPYAVALTAMALQGNNFWVTDRGNYSIKGSIYKCSKVSGKCTTFMTNLNNPRGIVANATVFKGSSPCMSNNGNCSHLCVQSREQKGYTCLCPNGMVKDNVTGQNCFFREFLLVVMTQNYFGLGALLKVPLNVKNPHVTIVPASIFNPVAVDYDYQEQRVYWTDLYYGSGRICRSFLNGSNQECIIKYLDTPQGLAIDGRARNLYFTDSNRNTLEVANLNGTYRKLLFNVSKPYDVALDTWKAMLFFSSCGNRPSLETASMTGQERKVLHQWAPSSSHCPHGLHYDRDTNRLYWTDGGFNMAYYLTVSSKIVTELSHLPQLSSPFGMTMDEKFFYLSSNSPTIQSVYQVDKETGKTVKTVYQTGLSKLGDLHVYKNITPPANLHPCNLGTSGCNYLCLPHQYGYRCECPDSPQATNCTAYDVINPPPTSAPPFRPCDPNPCMDATCSEVNTTNGVDFFCNCSLGHSGKRCQLYKGEKPPTLYIANDNKIRSVAIGSLNISTVVTGIDFAVAIDVDVRRNMLIFSDYSAEYIYSMNLTSGVLKKVVTDGVPSVEGIALDWEACNFYWTDYIMETVEVASCDGKYRKVLFHEGLANPRGIAVDPRVGYGYLFFTDWGTYKLYRANLDGDNLKVIVNLVDYESFITNGLLIDYEKNLLYWIESGKDRIWSSNFDGGFITFVTPLNPQKNVAPFDIVMYEHIIYWSDTFDQTIGRYNITTDTNLPNIYGPLGYIYGLAMEHHTRQPRGNQACAVNNGGCSQLCFLVSNGRECACAAGFKLADNKVTCLEITSKLLLSEAGRSQMRSVIRDEKYSVTTIPVSPKNRVYDPAAVTYDPLNKRMYWVDALRHKIYGSHINGSFAVEVIGGTEGAEQLAVDWSGNKLYWTSSAFNKIEVITLGEEKFRMTLIHENLTSPHGITLDLSNRFIYFTTWSNMSHTVERSDMDGGNRKILAILGNTKPTSLNLESSTNRLYWIEQATNTIRYLNLINPNGIVYTLLTFNQFTYDIRMTIDGPDVFIVDSGKFWLHFGGVYRCNKTVDGSCKRVVEGLVDPKDIVAYDSAFTPAPVNTECSINNGGCEQLCLPKQSGYRCACSDTAVLKADNKGCKKLVDFLVIAQYDSMSLTKVYPEKKQFAARLPILYMMKPEALAFDPERSEIYWSDVFYEDLNKATLDGEQKVIAREAYAAGVAVDVATGNTYWTNTRQESIEVASYNGTYRKTLISGIIQPRGIVLDIVNKYIFWGSLSHSNHKIERADMDGMNRRIVAEIGEVFPDGMFLLEHSDGNRICWVEHDKLRVRCATSGTDVSILIAKLPDAVYPSDITALAGYWYITDIGPPGVIYKCNKDNCEKFMTGLKSPKGIVSNANITTGENKCKESNGGCSHICLQSRSSEGRTCACPTGMVNNGTSGNSCYFKEFMLIAAQSFWSSTILKISLTTNAQISTTTINNKVLQITSVAFDQQEREVYWAQEGSMGGIYRSLLNGSNQQTVLSTNVIRPSAMEIDSLARNIYWADRDANKIEVCSLSDCSRTRKKLFSRKTPRSLVIDTFSGSMFFSSCGSRSLVEKAWMDGTNVRVIKSWPALSRHCIIDMAFDRMKNALYWVDSKYYHLQSMDLNTNKIQRVNFVARLPRALALDENFLYWADGYHSNVLKSDKHTGSYAGQLSGFIYGMQDIHVFKNVTLPEDTHPCTDKSLSNCSDLCLLNPEGYHCACADSSVGCNSTTVKITTTAAPTTTQTTTTKSTPPPTTTKPDPCAPNPCKNGGTCKTKDDGMKCSCVEGYTGEFCEVYYGENEVEVEFPATVGDQFNETQFRLAVLETLSGVCDDTESCDTSSVAAKRKRRSAKSPSSEYEKKIYIIETKKKGQSFVVKFVVVLEAKNAQNKTVDKVFKAKELQKVIAEREDTFATAFGRPIAKIDGKVPQAFIGKPTEPPSNVGRNVGIVLAVILVAIVLVVILYLYMTRWRKRTSRLKRNESTRSIHDFTNPGFMGEDNRSVGAIPFQMNEMKGSFENPTYGEMSVQPSQEVPVSSERQPQMRKLPLHESLTQNFYDSADEKKKEVDVDVDNNATKPSPDAVYVDVIHDQPNQS